MLEATDLRLKDLIFPYVAEPSLEIIYQYDFGDDWNHSLVLKPAQREA